MFRTLLTDVDARGVLSVTLNRPEIRNAFNNDMIEELTECFSKTALEERVRLVLLKSNGSVFCAGGDLNWMKDSIELSFEENLKETRKLTRMFQLMNECPKPLIAAVQGAAIGGGVGLVSVADLVLATQETQFSLSEVRLGIVPACIAPFVISKIGVSQARSLFISAERFQGPRAREIGLVHQVVSNEAALVQETEILLDRVLQCGPQAMQAAKKLVLDLGWPERRNQNEDCYLSVARTLAELRISPEGQEGVRAFLEKRKPNWILK